MLGVLQWTGWDGELSRKPRHPTGFLSKKTFCLFLEGLCYRILNFSHVGMCVVSFNFCNGACIHFFHQQIHVIHCWFLLLIWADATYEWLIIDSLLEYDSNIICLSCWLSIYWKSSKSIFLQSSIHYRYALFKLILIRCV